MIDFVSVTEIAGDQVTQEQITRLCNRYYWAAKQCKKRDVVEVACGTGQGLSFLKAIANSFVAGDISRSLLDIVRTNYGDRIDLVQFDAQRMPFNNNSRDIVILFEAIYYIPDARRFIKECKRILRPGGKILVSTANSDLYDFNPSPHSYRYFGTVGLFKLFESEGFQIRCFGDTPVSAVSKKQRFLRPIKKMVVSLNLMPKSMAGKKMLKRIVFGNLVEMPVEIDTETAIYTPPKPIPISEPDIRHKVIYCEAVKR